MAIQILANHAHVFPASFNPAGTIDRLLKLLDDCGIEEAVCFAPFPQQLETAESNPMAGSPTRTQGRDRLHAFGTLDLRRPMSATRFAGSRTWASVGSSFIPMRRNLMCSARPPWRRTARRRMKGSSSLFIPGFTTIRLKHYNVKLFDEVAWNFKDLRFSLEHVGGYSFFNEALAVIVNNIPFPPVPGRRCMVYAGLTSIFTPNYCRFWYMPRERLDELVAQAGVDQLIFGLDFPYNLEEATNLGLQTIRALGLTEAEQAIILGGNLRDALRLPAIRSATDNPAAAVAPD